MPAAQGKQKTVAVSSDDLDQPLQLYLNTDYRLVINEAPDPIAHVRLVLTNYLDKMPLKNVDYQLDGCGTTLSGRTDDAGTITHYQVPAGYYRLKVAGREYTIPTDPERERFHLLYVVSEAPVERNIPEDDEEELRGFSDEEIAALLDEGNGSDGEEDEDPETAVA
jgi:hypothetical protein